MRDAILHAFNWTYAEVAATAQEISNIGYSVVFRPPALYSDRDGSSCWQRYQPKDYRVIGSFVGEKAELELAINSLHDHGMRV